VACYAAAWQLYGLPGAAIANGIAAMHTHGMLIAGAYAKQLTEGGSSS
jgi:Na+/proline symporter